LSRSPPRFSCLILVVLGSGFPRLRALSYSPDPATEIKYPPAEEAFFFSFNPFIYLRIKSHLKTVFIFKLIM